LEIEEIQNESNVQKETALDEKQAEIFYDLPADEFDEKLSMMDELDKNEEKTLNSEENIPSPNVIQRCEIFVNEIRRDGNNIFVLCIEMVKDFFNLCFNIVKLVLIWIFGYFEIDIGRRNEHPHSE